MIWFILFLWAILGILAHYKFRKLAIKEGVLHEIDSLGIFLTYLLAPWWFFVVVWENVILGEWK